MTSVMSYYKFGFQSTIGSFGAMALFGLVALSGIALMMASRDPVTGERNTAMFMSGIALIVSTALPLLPYIGLSLVADELTQ
jgi:hypothetical protein